MIDESVIRRAPCDAGQLRTVATRDSKAPAAGALEVPPAAWFAFLSAVTPGGPATAAR
ncbi:DUF397 domain-containing protein [Amycolatopsis sp. CA-128772]|uniref:DUF397 domain-containing protein n=1 Tax=Amycolatopsis sp. CA-128772 TaxID=2073159 RepID=UPI00351A0854